MTTEATTRTDAADEDPDELAEWVESFDSLLAARGRERAASVLKVLAERASTAGIPRETAITTDYVNTIPVEDEPPFAGDEEMERRFRRLVRWNAAVLVHRAQRSEIAVGGHISTYAGAATLYEVGLNHFFRGPDHAGVRSSDQGGLQVEIGYRRLKIVDLSAAGNQPMTNETGRVWLVVNGEIFNFRALRAELEAAGHRFRSLTDS